MVIKSIGFYKMKGNLCHMTYHHMNQGFKDHAIDALEPSPNNQKVHFTAIVSFTKLDRIIESLTGDKLNNRNLHDTVKYFLPEIFFVILEESIKYRFLEIKTGVDRR